MPIPENPQSRSEQYLNAIATGDNSGLPEFPQSRMEQYLEVIAQNGEGGGGGVLVVHQDDNGVLDKTWQEIYDAANVGVVVLPSGSMGGELPLYLAEINHNPPLGSLPERWRVCFFSVVDGSVFAPPYDAESADSYPVYVGE